MGVRFILSSFSPQFYNRSVCVSEVSQWTHIQLQAVSLAKKMFFVFFFLTPIMFTLKLVQALVWGKKIIEFVLNQQQSPVRRLQKSWLTNNHFNTGGSNPNTPPHFSVWSPTWGREASEAFFFFFSFLFGTEEFGLSTRDKTQISISGALGSSINWCLEIILVECEKTMIHILKSYFHIVDGS